MAKCERTGEDKQSAEEVIVEREDSRQSAGYVWVNV